MTSKLNTPHSELNEVRTMLLKTPTQNPTKRRLNLSREKIKVQEAERHRVARELHDGISQLLTSVTFQLKSIEDNVSEKNKLAQANIQRTKELLNLSIQEIRRISHNLKPIELVELGLIPALKCFFKNFSKRTGINLNVQLSQVPENSAEIELTLYRIIQEALNNVEKHSQASAVDLNLSFCDLYLNLTIKDNGIGFKLSDNGSKSALDSGMGLINIKERALNVNGSISINTKPMQGTEIIVSIPRN